MVNCWSSKLKIANERLEAQVKTLELRNNSKIIPWIKWG